MLAIASSSSPARVFSPGIMQSTGNQHLLYRSSKRNRQIEEYFVLQACKKHRLLWTIAMEMSTLSCLILASRKTSYPIQEVQSLA